MMQRTHAAENRIVEAGVYFEPTSQEHCRAIVDIFNYYVENSFATYTATRVPHNFFDVFLKSALGITACDENGEIVGFGMLGVGSKTSAFSHTAEITYFIKPGYTGKGIGTSLLERLTVEAKKNDITSILASVSSKNRGSIHFHLKNGFRLAGRFLNVGRKSGQLFDIVWMQKHL